MYIDILENVPRTEYTCAVFHACRCGGYESAAGVTTHLVAASEWLSARDELPAVEGVSVDSGFSHRAERCNSRHVRVTVSRLHVTVVINVPIDVSPHVR